LRYLLLVIKKSTLPLIAFLALLWSCERYDFVSDGSVSLKFSADTVSFDTIFSPIGSATFTCKVYNRSSKNLIIDEVFLGKGNASPFLMNVDGRAGYSVRNLRLAKEDSLHIFLEVQKNSAQPLLTDSIVFAMGNTRQHLGLMAYAQEVVLFEKDTVLKNAFTFTAEKPYLILGSITVDSSVTATVDAGAKLFFGKNCGIIVNGKLVVNGLSSSPCIFSHPRYKEDWYSDASGQWQGITVNASGKIEAVFAQLQGARQAFYVQDTLSTAVSKPQLNVSRSKIENSEVGVNVCNGSAHIDNCLIAHSATNALLLQGGTCKVYQATFATYSTAQGYHSAQVVVQNFRLRGVRDTVSAPLDSATFGNCIIYGSNVSELSINQRLGTDMRYQFESCIIKSKAGLNGFISVKNEDPKFKDVSKNDFHLSENSPAIHGSKSIADSYKIDLDGFDRTIEQDSSMGCYVYRKLQ
jgi:hypothetical protein